MNRRDILKAAIAAPVAAAVGVPLTITKSGHRSGKTVTLQQAKIQSLAVKNINPITCTAEIVFLDIDHTT